MVKAHFFMNATYLSAPLHYVSQWFKDRERGEREAERFAVHTTSKLVLTEEQPWTSVDAFLMAMCL